jgi:hypothetical protein
MNIGDSSCGLLRIKQKIRRLDIPILAARSGIGGNLPQIAGGNDIV